MLLKALSHVDVANLNKECVTKLLTCPTSKTINMKGCWVVVVSLKN